jgi:hypothetical protein
MSFTTVTLPPGTRLFRSAPYEKDPSEPVWFTQTEAIAKGYSPEERASEFTPSKDLVLLDLWTPDSWAWIRSKAESPMDTLDIDSYSGTGYVYETEDDRSNDFVKAFYTPLPDAFAGGVLEPRTQTKEITLNAKSPLKYHVLNWRGLPWGPHKGEYKRYSSLGLDTGFITFLRRILPKEIEGVLSPIVPAPMHSVRPLGLRKAFHDELVLFPPIESKLTVVKQGGRRRKQTRRRSRFNKQVRLTRRNAVHLKH